MRIDRFASTKGAERIGTLETKDYRKRIYEEMADNLRVEDTWFELDGRLHALAARLRALPRGDLLELGCGRGQILRQICQIHNAYGVDFDESAAREAGKWATTRQLDLDHALSPPFDKKYDYIICSEVLEHLMDPRNAFLLANQWLKTNGRLIVTVPNVTSLRILFSMLCGAITGAGPSWITYPSVHTEKVGHIRLFSFRSLSTLGKQTGFRVVSKRGVGWQSNGRIWQRMLFGATWLLGSRKNWNQRVRRADDALCHVFPTLSPGLLFEYVKVDDTCTRGEYDVSGKWHASSATTPSATAETHSTTQRS